MWSAYTVSEGFVAVSRSSGTCMASVSAGKIVTVCSCGVNPESAKLAPFQTQITHVSNVFY